MVMGIDRPSLASFRMVRYSFCSTLAALRVRVGWQWALAYATYRFRSCAYKLKSARGKLRRGAEGFNANK